MLPRPGGSAGLIGSFHYPVPSKELCRWLCATGNIRV
jgi:hypothetical protein